MKIFDNLPDSDHTPYPVLDTEPHLRDIARYMRPSDYGIMAGVGFGIPAFLTMLERMSPTQTRALTRKGHFIQVPFFLTVGAIFAAQSSLFRFWGWKENAAEATRYQAQLAAQGPQRKKAWNEFEW